MLTPTLHFTGAHQLHPHPLVLAYGETPEVRDDGRVREEGCRQHFSSGKPSLMPGWDEGSSPGLILLLPVYTINTGGFVCLLSQTRSSLDASTELTVRVRHKVDSM